MDVSNAAYITCRDAVTLAMVTVAAESSLHCTFTQMLTTNILNVMINFLYRY